jgi:tetratricopeptide (TPR) repeat protein
MTALAGLGTLEACSSAPKRPAEIFALRSAAETQLELANREADRGNQGAALELLAEGRRLAVSADDPPLLIRTALARGNILFAQGQAAEAARAWESALAEADRAGERGLAALCRVYRARSRLLAAAGTPGAGEEAAAVRASVAGELALLKDDRSATALAWTVMGLAEKEGRRWAEAEAAVKKALEIHEKDNYLEQAAYDWFLIASIRSAAGSYAAAREALGRALALDRRAENSFGLAADWRALGDVHRKAGEPAEAAAAYRRAGEIFRSIGLEREAAAAEGR